MLKPEFMSQFVLALLVALRASFRAQADVVLEILALRQQVAMRSAPNTARNKWTMNLRL